jgi:hypothetical protein
LGYDSFRRHGEAVALVASLCLISAQLYDDLAEIARHEACAATARDATDAWQIAQRAHILQKYLEHSAMSFEQRGWRERRAA